MTTIAETLRSLASGVEHGRIRGPELVRLEGSISTAAACVRRNAAVRRLGELIGGELESPWRVAGKVAQALDGFERSGAWVELQAGRKPRSTFEQVAQVILQCPGPRDQRRLFDVIRGY